MNIEILKEYVELAINRSFTNTARNLNVSHSSLSRHIATLEKELGEQLIIRTNPLELTQAGKIVLKKASAILFELEDTRRLLRKTASPCAARCV